MSEYEYHRHADGAVVMHAIPATDTIEHECTAEGDCVCGPTTEPIPRDDGSVGWVIVHHALDGRT